MDSQGSDQVSNSHQNFPNPTQPITTNDSPDFQYVGINTSHSQIRIPEYNIFAQPGHFPNQLPPLNPQVPFNVLNASYPSHLQPHGPQFSFQGLLNSPNSPPPSQTFTSSKASKKKGKPSKNSQETQPMSRRNWTTAEDIALTKAWLYISVDSIVGKDQTSERMWNRILSAWRENMGEYDETRNTNGLSCRWGVIQAAVTKFQGAYETLESNPQSGTNLENLKREAMRIYSNHNGGQSFKFEHCWEIMKQNPKWCSHQLTKVGGSKKQKVMADTVRTLPISTPTSEPSLANGDDNIDSSNITIENSKTSEIVRPLGRKGSKEKKKKTDEEKGVISVLTNLQSSLDRQFAFTKEELELKKERDNKEYVLRKEAIEMEMKFKKEVQKRKDQERILNRDLTKLQPAFREAVERMQAQILKEWEKDGLFGEVSSSEDAEA